VPLRGAPGYSNVLTFGGRMILAPVNDVISLNTLPSSAIVARRGAGLSFFGGAACADLVFPMMTKIERKNNVATSKGKALRTERQRQWSRECSWSI
jgi:hypothetical protein